MSIDAQQGQEQSFKEYLEECLESLELMEQGLLDLGSDGAGNEKTLEEVRSAIALHNSKCAVFKCSQMVELSSGIKRLLAEVIAVPKERIEGGANEALQKNSYSLSEEQIDLLLKSIDCLRDQCLAIDADEEIDVDQAESLVNQFSSLFNRADEAGASSVSADGDTLQNSINTRSGSKPDRGEKSTKEIAQKRDNKAVFEGDSIVNESVEKETAPSLSNTSKAVDDIELATARSSRQTWKIILEPKPQLILTLNEPLQLFQKLKGIGDLIVETNFGGLPASETFGAEQCSISWTLTLTTSSSKNDVLAKLKSIKTKCIVQLTLWNPDVEVGMSADEVKREGLDTETSVTSDINADTQASIDTTADEISNDASDIKANELDSRETDSSEKEDAPSAGVNVTSSAVMTAISDNLKATLPKQEAKKTVLLNTSKPKLVNNPSSDEPRVRVSLDHLSSLIDLVGELVITQSMLSELSNNFDMSKFEQLSSGLDQLVQNTREIQDSLIQIRMVPMSTLNDMLTHAVNNAADRAGKNVSFDLLGGETLLDKVLIDQLIEPLCNLLTYAIDQSIETSEARVGSGKASVSTITLDSSAYRDQVIIEIKDDGKGLNVPKIRHWAINNGLIDADSTLNDAEISSFIFNPEFDVSECLSLGIVMNEIHGLVKSLGGHIDVDSTSGKGSCYRVHLPPTLAINEGQLVRVGQEVYVIPLINVGETLEIDEANITRVSGNMEVYRLADDYIPIIPINQTFAVQPDSKSRSETLLVIAEVEGQKVALQVDELLSQQQIVTKSLEPNYKSIDGVSGATILGDGSVVLIIDVAGLLRRVVKGLGQAA